MSGTIKLIPGKPSVYITFVKTGPRKPLYVEDGEEGICELVAGCLNFYHKPVKTARRKLTLHSVRRVAAVAELLSLAL